MSKKNNIRKSEDSNRVSREKCSECGSIDLIRDEQRGELICSKCGIVVESQAFSSAPEWRAYSSEEHVARSRVGSPISPLRAEMGFRVQISNSRRDSTGQYLSPSVQSKFSRLSKMDNMTRSSKIRNLQFALKELKRIRSQLELSEDIAKAAANYYRMALKKNLIRGRSIDGMVTASLYLACRKKQAPLTLKDITSVASVSPKELGRCVRILLHELNIKSTPSDYNALIHRLGGALKLTMATRKLATDIMLKAREKGITVGKNPMSIAAASLYIAAIKTGERRTQQEIAKVARTTPVTIRNRFKELLHSLGEVIDEYN